MNELFLLSNIMEISLKRLFYPVVGLVTNNKLLGQEFPPDLPAAGRPVSGRKT
jgi:hypothetical protein